jgi:hypothetical protein
MPTSQEKWRYWCRSGFSVMYASLSFETCVVETLVRDRFTHRLKRTLPLAAVLARGYARISTQPDQELNLLDLRDSGCVDIGAPTDAVRARHFAAGRRSEKRCMRSTRMWMDSSMRQDWSLAFRSGGAAIRLNGQRLTLRSN